MFSPYGAASDNPTASWHPEPTFRGTYSILSTCIVTLGLCVWTSLHLNIPAYGKASQQWRKKLVWLVVGLFAPELVGLSRITPPVDELTVFRLLGPHTHSAEKHVRFTDS
ncbi:hypothetical protein NA56DRAFT_453094 [Hyaloscypha hepaticicola]|uniref:Uncharacterized protein n=1 Tax=Hyaloscypha hepaticicola TaxID=2082293 RepID=A0A2J6PG13_9HELO|nr:hypothetical protein NA56DRAFT_453094 [Hyaloscypha hepaticicola]